MDRAASQERTGVFMLDLPAVAKPLSRASNLAGRVLGETGSRSSGPPTAGVAACKHGKGRGLLRRVFTQMKQGNQGDRTWATGASAPSHRGRRAHSERQTENDKQEKVVILFPSSVLFSALSAISVASYHVVFVVSSW